MFGRHRNYLSCICRPSVGFCRGGSLARRWWRHGGLDETELMNVFAITIEQVPLFLQSSYNLRYPICLMIVGDIRSTCIVVFLFYIVLSIVWFTDNSSEHFFSGIVKLFGEVVGTARQSFRQNMLLSLTFVVFFYEDNYRWYYFYFRVGIYPSYFGVSLVLMCFGACVG